MTDTIQHLRELMAKHRGLKPAWDNYGSAALFDRNQVQAIVAITNAIPALLDVAEAAHEIRKVQRQCAYDATICAAGRTYSEMTRLSLEQDCDCALALLSNTKPEVPETK